ARIRGEGGRDGRGRWRRAGRISGRPYEVIAERARLFVLADLIRTVEDRTGAFDDPGLASFETWRRHASGVRRIRAIGLAESVFGDTIEAEGGEYARPGNQIPLIDVRAYRGRVERRAEAAVGAALCDGVFIYLVVQDGVDIHEVHAVG